MIVSEIHRKLQKRFYEFDVIYEKGQFYIYKDWKEDSDKNKELMKIDIDILVNCGNISIDIIIDSLFIELKRVLRY